MPDAVWSFRRVTREDFPLVASWLAQPEVHRWWQHEWSAAAVERDFGSSVDGAEPNEDWLALRDGSPVGLVQCSAVADYEENLADFSALGEVPPRAITLDYLLGETRGQGLGTDMLRAFVARCWAERPEAPAVLLTVIAANRPSWRALERVGFRIVGEGDCEPGNPDDDPLHYLLRLDRPGVA